MFTTHSARRAVPLAALAAMAAMALLGGAACGTGGASGGGNTVLASFYPVAWVAQQVGGDEISVTNLTKPGAEPHDLELTPRQIADLGRARLVVYVKGVQPAVDQAVRQHAEDRAVDVVALVKTIPAAPHTAQAAQEAGAAESGTEEEHGHQQTSYDPHVWLDPSRLAAIATALGERLAAADQAHAAAYRRNASAVAATLTGLDGEFRTGLATCEQRTIVTSHDAFGYLVDRYRLTQTAITGLSPESEPSPKRLAELTQVVKDTKVTTVFTETLVNPKIAETLA